MKKFLKILACTSVSIVWWCVVACATVVTAIVVVFMLSGDGDVYQTMISLTTVILWAIMIMKHQRNLYSRFSLKRSKVFSSSPNIIIRP